MAPNIKEPFPTRKSEPITSVISPFQKFFRYEASSGILLILVVLLAMIWANSFLAEWYESTWQIGLSFAFGDIKLDKPLILWINDLLMAFFFLYVGLEIKREFLIGELKSYKKAMLPFMAALGGIILPALIFFVFNIGNSEALDGWAVPVATDIAFALGMLYLLGNKVPSTLKVFLASLAIIDDLAAILIIAIFYTEQLYFNYLLVAAIALVLLAALNLLHVRKIAPYVLIGAILWYGFLKSGIHGTIAGVLLAMTIPATTKIDYGEFKEKTNNLIGNLNQINPQEKISEDDLSTYLNSIEALELTCRDVEAPLLRLERGLSPYIAFFVMPIFALANAGIIVSGDVVQELGSSLVLGIIFGLSIGKPLGITLLAWVSVRLGWASLPTGVTWRHIVGAGFLAGIGFTMSIFIGTLAFTSGSTLSIVKIAILITSAISAIAGLLILRSSIGADAT